MTLGYLARAVVQALSVYALVSGLLALAVAVVWHRVAGAHALPATTSRRLFLLRLAPSSAGALATVMVAVAYARWEVREDAERVGLVAMAAAVASCAMLAAAAWRGARAVGQTWRIGQALARTAGGRLPALPFEAYVIDSRFPVVALVGLLVLRLFVARRVIEACTAEEFEAIVAHEQAHAGQRDNLRRLAMVAAPDLLGLVPVGRRLHEAWLHAAELAADHQAAARTAGGVHLASALVKVARLATSPGAPLPASALYRGEPIAERVHRLLDPSPSPASAPWPLWARLLGAWVAVAAGVATLPFAHAAAEAILRWGP